MLTESEREWLRYRKKDRKIGLITDEYFFCKWCYPDAKAYEHYCYPKCADEEYICVIKKYVREDVNMWQEAAEFSERVSLKLLKMPKHYPEGPCDYGNAGYCSYDCDSIWLDCREARLKWARLLVEEEMDGES